MEHSENNRQVVNNANVDAENQLDNFGNNAPKGPNQDLQEDKSFDLLSYCSNHATNGSSVNSQKHNYDFIPTDEDDDYKANVQRIMNPQQ